MNAPLDRLPTFGSVVAVCAHPDDESFGLGAVLSALAERGSATSVLCFTHGEASTLGAATTPSHLAEIRATELANAAEALGVTTVRLHSYADGALESASFDELVRHIVDLATERAADCLLVFDEGGITGHPDHQRATRTALAAADQRAVPVLAWTLPQSVTTVLNDEFHAGFVGRPPDEIDFVLEVDRHRQRAAIACHATQATDNPVLKRRLALQADSESLRWLRAPSA